MLATIRLGGRDPSTIDETAIRNSAWSLRRLRTEVSGDVHDIATNHKDGGT
jgi:hypothetical protein